MVPIQTFLVLLAALVMLSSCSQKLPPHPGNDALLLNNSGSNSSTAPLNHRNPNPNPIIKPDGPGSDTPLTVTPSQLTIRLAGQSALKIYQLLAIAPTPLKSSTLKQGADFFCMQTGTVAACDIILYFPHGEVLKQLDDNQIQSAAPEIAQIESNDGTISIPPAEQGAKATVSISGNDAKTIYDVLNIPERTYDLMPDSVNAAGVHKAGESVNCTKEALAATPTDFIYACYLHLNLSKGSVDKVDPNSMQ